MNPEPRPVRQPGPNDPVDNAEVKAALARVQRDADRGVSAHSVKDQFAERLLRTLDALQNSPEGWRLSGTWLVEEVGGCTCGSPLGPYPHEPNCGLEPVVCLEALPGWGSLVAEIKAQARQEMTLLTEETDPNGGDTVARTWREVVS